ncbi:guanylate kinase-like [Xenia sp. Carnegie-2017]|uniref:guanylate kinase-like n=1 Tax=Xenia sp. Carnegie-2017 TaxID=2897299 RepID=UPI001F03EB97|nr:guanylate kinase-like [Xenia sp. Carnegie-2017]XP_046859938.1 guanylate kinase-like [Xenia sp. Carnegie-2017]
MSTKKLLVLSGPSGAGKSTLLKQLLKEYPNNFGFSVSHTTRKPRSGEVDGKDYHFSQREEMSKAIEDGEFLEHACYSGNMYGTSKKAVRDVQEQGKICILDVDRQGILNVKNAGIDAFYLFIKPPSMAILEKRLRGRGTETEDSIQKRLGIAKADLEYAEVKDAYDATVINDDLQQSYSQLKEVISMNICPLI